MKINSYLTDPEFPSQSTTASSTYLSDAIYGEVVQKMPIFCTDVVFTSTSLRTRELWLAKRAVYPMKGVWVIGGRMHFNDESPLASIRRCVKRETKMDISPNRFLPIALNHYGWARTAQGEFPGKNVALTYRCDLSVDEIGRISSALIAAEYEPDFGLQPFSSTRLETEKCHPMLLSLYHAIFS